MSERLDYHELHEDPVEVLNILREAAGLVSETLTGHGPQVAERPPGGQNRTLRGGGVL